MTYPRILIRDFSKGWNSTDLPTELADDEFYSSQSPNAPDPTRVIERPDVADAQFPKLLNFFVTNLGRLKVRGGEVKITPNLPGNPSGFTRFFTQTLARLVYAVGNTVYAYNEATQAIQSLGTVTPGKIDFVALYNKLYWCDGVKAYKWNGTSPSLEPLGLVAPAAAGTASAGAAGLLDSSFTGALPYQWFFTFVEADGTESNPSPGSNLLPLHLQQANLANIPISSNPMVTMRNVYRTGGTSTTYRLIGTVNNNTATTFTDNTSDPALGPNLLNFAHDPAPPNLSFMASHKNRLFAAGDSANPYRLYFSSYGQPAYWPTVVYDAANDGGYLDLPDPEFGNPIVGLTGTGSLLIVASQKAFYALYGDSQQDFVFRKVMDTGCLARRTLVQCKNTVLFVGSDKMIYSLQDTEPTPIALPLEATLQAISEADMANASAVYQDQRYTLFIPQVGLPPVNMSYDFRAGCWTDLSDPKLAAGDCYGYPSTTLQGQTLIATTGAYLDMTGAAYAGILSVFSKSFTGETLNVDFKTPDFEFGRPSYTKRAKQLKIEGVYGIGNAGPLIATITAYTPGRTPVQKSYPLVPSATTGKLLDVELSPVLIGRVMNVEISGSVVSLEINTLEIAFQFIREAA